MGDSPGASEAFPIDMNKMDWNINKIKQIVYVFICILTM